MGKKGRKFARLLCAVLALVTVLLSLSLVGYAEETEEDEGENAVVDFVLVLDCSGSLKDSDPNRLCATACKMFLDMVPLENARVSFIAFGYQDGTPYTLETMSITNPRDLGDVHLLAPLAEASALKEKQDVKEIIDEAISFSYSPTGKTVTPLGTATLSAVDMLQANNSADGNACVVLLTDGDISANQSYGDDETNAYTAAAVAANHDWPIFTIHLNNNNEFEEHAVLMKAIAEQSGAGAEGYCSLTSFAQGSTDVAQAFLNIFNRFMFGGEGEVEVITSDENGLVESSVEVPELTSETTIVVSGNNLEKIELVNPEGTARDITSNVDEQNIVALFEGNSYACIKLICPLVGAWTVRAYGDPNATIAMYDCSMKDLDLELNTDLADPNAVLSKNDDVTFNAFFTYHGKSIHTSGFYAEKQPMLVVTNTVTGQTKEFAMEANNDGYALTLPMAEIGEGAFTATARLDDDMFRNGSKWSNGVGLRTENLPTSLNDPSLPALTGYVNGKFEKIDLQGHVNNPDGDALEYTFECISDRNKVFDYTIDENGYLYIDCGLEKGQYDIQITVRDKDMSEAMLFDVLKLTVENNPFEFTEIEPVEVWIDSYSWQGEVPEYYEVNLGDHYYDPDGLPMEVTDVGGEGDGTFYEVKLEGEVLSVSPLEKGEGVIHFTVSDGVDSSEFSVEVEVVSGKAVFWAENWIWFALALAAIVLIVLIILLISANTRVKGKWNVTIQSGFSTATIEGIDFHVNTKVGRKKTFLLKDLLNAIVPLMNGGAEISAVLPNFLVGTGVENIVMKGILGGRGCIMDNLPVNNPMTTVSYNGLENQKKLKVLMGEVVLNINTLSGDNLRITMTL